MIIVAVTFSRIPLDPNGPKPHDTFISIHGGKGPMASSCALGNGWGYTCHAVTDTEE